jgi:hemerythrin-like domain-containing protein
MSGALSWTNGNQWEVDMFDLEALNRRGVLALAALATGVVGGGFPAEATDKAASKDSSAGDDDISATEDLMREHGVLRRALIVYGEVASRLRTGRRDVPLAAIAEAAKLFREFGENYHERLLEEQYVFPEVRKGGGPNEKLVEVLLAQHQRAREITAYLEQLGGRGRIGADAQPLSRALAGMSRMYHAHATWEDTVVFPAWRKLQSKERLDELAKKFEEMEHQQFGKDGFEDGLERMSRVEQMLALSDLGTYTAAPPPRI